MAERTKAAVLKTASARKPSLLPFVALSLNAAGFSTRRLIAPWYSRHFVTYPASRDNGAGSLDLLPDSPPERRLRHDFDPEPPGVGRLLHLILRVGNHEEVEARRHGLDDAQAGRPSELLGPCPVDRSVVQTTPHRPGEAHLKPGEGWRRDRLAAPGVGVRTAHQAEYLAVERGFVHLELPAHGVQVP